MRTSKMPVIPIDRITDVCGVPIDTFWIVNCEHRRLYLRLIGHTAVLVRIDGILYVYESTQLGSGGVKGVQLTELTEWLDSYPGKVKLKPVWIINKETQKEAFELAAEHVKKHLGKPYTDPMKRQGRWMLIKSAWDSRWFKKMSTNIDTEKWFFCTMLVMNIFRFCGLVLKNLNCAEWEPDDTRDAPRGRLNQVLCSYVRVESEIRIK